MGFQTAIKHQGALRAKLGGLLCAFHVTRFDSWHLLVNPHALALNPLCLSPTVPGSLSSPQVCDLASPTEAMQRFQEYLGKQGVESNDAPESPPKRQRPDAAEEPPLQQNGTAAPECKICYCRGINAVFAGCGHLVCCLVCAYRVDKCPVCRVQVRSDQIIRTFTA